jgi:hypothetical protein
MAYVFPSAPTVGQRYTVNPGTSGEAQYIWDGSTWDVVPNFVVVGVQNQDAYNSYQWPNSNAATPSFLVNDGTGALSWLDYSSPTGGLFMKMNNPLGFNAYVWPDTDGTTNYQLTTDGAGNLSWQRPSVPTLTLIFVDETLFDGVQQTFQLYDASLASFTPEFPTNLLVFLGGVPQIYGPSNAYIIVGSTITFTQAPQFGTTYYSITSEIVY